MISIKHEATFYGANPYAAMPVVVEVEERCNC